MEFTSYASGSRANAYEVYDGKTRLLLEAGLPIKELRRRPKFSTSGADAVLLTHEHQDHSRGIREIMKAGVDCYTSAGTAGALDLPAYRTKIIESGVQFRIGSWQIMPFDTIHDAMEPLGFLLYSEALKEKMLFATDTAYIKYQFSGLTHIAIEANYCRDLLEGSDMEIRGLTRLIQTHMSLQRVKRMLQATDLSKLQAVFLLHLSNSRSDEGLFRQEVQEQTGCPTYVCSDSETETVGFC